MKYSSKVIIFFLGLIFSHCYNLRADIFDDISSIEKDKYIHFSAGAAISHISYPLFKRYKNKRHAMYYSFSTAVLFSLGKEFYDDKFSWGDLAFGSLGALTIIVVEF
ncbi:MAG: hypothetical protein ACOC5R_00945 [Elusimicrobiota bacterium]